MLAALRKILILEERMTTLADDLKNMAKLTKDLDRRLRTERKERR